MMVIKKIVFETKRKKWSFVLNNNAVLVNGTSKIDVDRAVIVQGLKGDKGDKGDTINQYDIVTQSEADADFNQVVLSV